MPDDEPTDYLSHGTGRLKRVYRANSVMQAEFLRGVLESEGIAAVVQGAALELALSPMLGGSTLPSVFVREQDFDAAVDLIARYQNGWVAHGGPWTCPECGEEIEGQFTECWKCGTERAGDDMPKPAIPLSGDALDYEVDLNRERERRERRDDDD